MRILIWTRAIAFSLGVLAFLGTAIAQTPIERESGEWIRRADSWYEGQFLPLFGAVGDGIWAARTHDRLVGDELLYGFAERYWEATEEFVELVGEHSGDNGLQRRVFEFARSSGDEWAQALSTSLTAVHARNFSAHRVLRGLHEGELTRGELELWYEIARLWNENSDLWYRVYSEAR